MFDGYKRVRTFEVKLGCNFIFNIQSVEDWD
jgi:hypothetical protein